MGLGCEGQTGLLNRTPVNGPSLPMTATPSPKLGQRRKVKLRENRKYKSRTRTVWRKKAHSSSTAEILAPPTPHHPANFGLAARNSPHTHQLRALQPISCHHLTSLTLAETNERAPGPDARMTESVCSQGAGPAYCAAALQGRGRRALAQGRTGADRPQKQRATLPEKWGGAEPCRKENATSTTTAKNGTDW